MDLRIVPLETNRRLLTWVSVMQTDKDVGILKRFAYKISGLIIFATCFSVTIASITYYLKLASTNLEKSLYSLAQIAAFTSMTYIIIVTFFIRNQIPSIFDGLYKICRTSKLHRNIFKSF